MKKHATIWIGILATLFLLSNAAMAAPNFMVNAGGSDADAFYRVAVTPDGGYAGFGKAGDDAVAAKFNAHGYMEWAKSFHGIATSNCNSGAAGSDGLFLVGRTASDTLWVAKLAPWGRILWQKTYTHTAYASANLMGTATVATADGGCAIGLRINVDGASGSYNYDQGLAKIAADGTLEWVKFYGTAAYDFSGEMIESRDASGNPDGYLMVTAEDGWSGAEGDNEVILIKVDANGVKQWVRSYAGFDTSEPAVPDGNEFVKGICQTADAGYAVVGYSYSASDPAWNNRRTPYILKVDHAGDLAWAKRFGILSSDPGANGFGYGDVAQAADNTDLILAGTYYNDKFWLLRLSSDGGQILDEVVYPSSGSVYDQLGSVAPTADGGAVASRWSKTFGAGDYDAFLMKFDTDLSFPGTDCDNGTNPGSQIADMQFDGVDVTANCHELDYTAQWTTADKVGAADDPGFWLWHCAVAADDDNDGVDNQLDNCPATSNVGQEEGDGDGIGNACDCDLNNDGNVNQLDFMQFRGLWGTADATADFDADGGVDQADFMILRGRWGTAYPWY